ncbi:septum site-determining protein MinC [Pelistega indica]|uniref:Probable septum site-determining protein MinC n=1 Tax=Pelistega indica TaxID=1414851 RepID=V8G3D9_9BURK|nr:MULTISPECIES: septum site-determining protein MinC [Pelistega]ETD70202.1 septum site-determining protein MinC [Pelistega indica]
MSDTSHILEFKSTNISSLRLVLKTTDFSGIVKTIHQKMQDSGSLFEGESLVIDAYGIVQPLPWRKLVDVLEQYKLNVLGIYANERLLPTVLAEGFAHIELSNHQKSDKTVVVDSKPAAQQTPSSQDKPQVSQPVSTTPTNTDAQASLVVDRQLRSGERIYAANSDLIVIGNVGHGAEVIADGNIHIYGSLLGRAIAGAKGDTSARIFTISLDPQLVAIAGIYRLFDGDIAPDTHKKPTMISLQNDTLSFNLIKS